MPLIDAAGTSVDKISPDKVKNSMPPERTWLNMSVSEPSWLLGKICRSKRPLVSALIAAAISLARTFIGWESGRLLAYLYEKSAALARTTMGAPRPPRTAEAAEPFNKVRREKLILFSLSFLCEPQSNDGAAWWDQADPGDERLLQRASRTAISAFGRTEPRCPMN